MGTLRSKEVTTWLRSRYAKHSKEEYLLSETELAHLEDVKHIFKEFDKDRSGTLELPELVYMFKAYGLTVKQAQLRDLFSVVRPKNRNSLSFEEFRRFAMGTEGAESTDYLEFKHLMMELKEKEPYTDKFIPGDISSMIRHLILMKKSQLLISRLGTTKDRPDSQQTTDLDIFQRVFALKHSVNKMQTQRNQPYVTELLPRDGATSDYRSRLVKKIDLARKSKAHFRRNC